MAMLRSDRGLFLINALGFLLMPGLLFSLLKSRRGPQGGVDVDVVYTACVWLRDPRPD